MAGDLKLQYGTDAAFTMTGIEDIDANNGAGITGWSSASIDNTSVEAVDYLVSGTFTTEGANRQAGYIYVYAYAVLADAPTWPDLFSAGTEGSVGAATCHTTYTRDSGMRLVAAITVDNTNSAVFTFPPTSIAAIFGGSVPPLWALWVTSNAATTTADWCTNASVLYYMPIFAQYT